MRYLAIVFACVVLIAFPVDAQPAHACGAITSLSVIYDRVDAAGFAPRLKVGGQQQFDCIVGHDPNFSVQRFRTTAEAMNYWLGLLGQELGVNMLPLPNN